MGVRHIPRRSFANTKPADKVVPPAPVKKVAPKEVAKTPVAPKAVEKPKESFRDRMRKRREEELKRRRERQKAKKEPEEVPAPEPVPDAPELPVSPPVQVPPPAEVPPPVEVPPPADPYEGKTREQWWTDRFPKRPVLYRAQDGNLRDVRNFIFEHSHILDQVIAQANLKGANDNQTVFNCCMFVQDNIRYVGDEEARGQVEFWQNPEDTITRGTGDCEDGAILMKSLTQCAGVPDWKVKIVAGDVKGGGHAYCTYIRDDDTQCILDWCYWPNRLPVNQRKAFYEEENYYDIWFSFNNANSFAETRITYGKGEVEKHTAVKKPAPKPARSIASKAKPRTRPVKL
jgi:predicted transglutaminase-like cysteine proteinase